MQDSNLAQKRKVFAASAIGTTIEWYDFFIYSTSAALVFSSQFFSAMDPSTALLTSMATIGVTFLARPLGSAIIGHFGDKLGRKKMLVLTLGIMGGATFLVGVLPTYAQVGVWAPVLLVVLRFLQGFSAGGEWAGAALMAVEHAPAKKRGQWGSASQIGTPIGLILATAVFLLMVSVTSDAQFMAWGWRIPFFVSILMVLVGYYIRAKIDESPAFAEMKKTHDLDRTPLYEVFRLHKRPLIIAAATFLGNNMAGYIFLSFLLSYATNTLGMHSDTMLGVQITGSVVWLISIAASGYLTDLVGARRLYLIGFSLQVIWAVPFMLLVGTSNLFFIYVAAVILTASLGLSYGGQSALFASLFPTRVRYSGASIAYALGAILGGGPAPFVATWLIQSTGSALSVGLYLLFAGLISLVATLAIRKSDLVGLPHGPGADATAQELAEAGS
ncbi:MFS transporter [Arthrobacter rhombi]|uniref:MFS transporter n=1 Tax=Arthrobacter rhombi TaxID=71253 RepID=UPI0031D2E480